MRIVVTGGAGFLGSLVVEELLEHDEYDEIVTLDLAPARVQHNRVSSVVGNLTDPDALQKAVTEDTAAIFHLAAVLSGGSEEDFDLAMQVNVDGTRALLEAARAVSAARTKTGGGEPVRFVFTSSLAVFGGAVPNVVPETWAEQPDSTYGAFKAVGELLVNEYSRKQFVDGRICRLPTISVRPGVPNSAASSFASGIIREPLAGIRAECPVPHETRMWLSSPRTAVTNLVHAMKLPGDRFGDWRGLNIPGISVTVGEMLESLERVGGPQARSLVSDEPDQRVMGIVCSWPGEFDVERLLGLGFVRDESFDDVVQEYEREFGPGGAP